MKKLTFSTAALTLGIFLLGPAAPAAAQRLESYLPAGTSYDPAVPRPAQVLGWELGEWHVRHDQLVAYARALAESSERVRLEVTGRTHEDRLLLLLTISSPTNLARLGEIRERRRELADPRSPMPDLAGMPVVAYMGYSVHGNEPSGANASMAVAYHLAAGQGPEVEELLENAVVLLDPSLNPDGLSRFAQWANMHRGRVLVADPEHREHREGWPSGRTNHYWFDLNRDWLLAQHPESQARLRSFHAWKPNVLTDFHEMGTDATYFFQPGVESRQNPLTPERNLELTREIARYNARALDARGRLYYTEETFDDFYYGKGSTYPDLQGSVGILFEQASARGHLQESTYGLLSFPFTIENQAITSLATLRAAVDHREDLLRWQGEHFRQALREGAGGDLGAYVFGDARDPARTRHLVELLLRHAAEVRELGRTLEAGDERFEPGAAYAVPLAQAQAPLVRAVFERRTDFEDSTFYDVSTWTLPLAFGLPSAEVARGELGGDLLGARVEKVEMPAGSMPPAATEAGSEAGNDVETYAYAFAWDGYYAPRALGRLLAAGVKAMVATRPFEAEVETGNDGERRSFERGTIVVPAGVQEKTRGELAALLGEAAGRDGVDVHGLASGLTPEGIDLGSPSLVMLERPRPALLVGSGISTYEAGEVWHLLDHRFEMELTLLDVERLGRVDLSRYTHLILVDGRYRDLGEKDVAAIAGWVRAGGVLIAGQEAAPWAEKAILEPAAKDGEESQPAPPGHLQADFVERDRRPQTATPEEGERRPYGDYQKDRAEQLISGTIFEVELDLTHPLAYGYRRERLPVFRSGTAMLRAPESPYVTVARYTPEPLLSGYVSEENLEELRGAPAIVAERMGRGAVVRIADNPSFRGFWYGTNKLLLNALFFGGILEETPG